MSEYDSSTEETVNAIIEQCEHSPVQFNSHEKTRRKLRPNRQELTAEQLEMVRKKDNERKQKRRQEMCEEERQLFLNRENEYKRQRRMAAGKIHKIRAKEAERKRNARKNMAIERLEEFRARDAERKRLARQKVKMSKHATSSLKPHSQKQAKIKRLTLGDSEEVQTTESRRDRMRSRTDSEEADIQSNSDVDSGESCEFGKIMGADETDDRVKELEAVLNDLLEDQDGAPVCENNSAETQIKVCENRAAQLEEQIWQLIDEKEQIDNAPVQSDEVMTIMDSNEEFSQLENRILKIIHNHYDEIEDLIDELKS